jgi:cytochrome c biogenesis protein CcmG, thiol:disulfide interchange protein DsbE
MMKRRDLMASLAAPLLLGGAETKTATKTVTKKPAVVVPKGPDMTIWLPGGKTTKVSALKGGVAVVEIFKTTCPHCQKSMPIIDRVYRENKAKGMRAIAVAVDQNPELLVPQFAKNYGITFPIGWAPIEEICKFMEVEPMNLYVPAMMIFDRSGKMRGRYPGGDSFFNMEEMNLRNTTEMLLKEPPRR